MNKRAHINIYGDVIGVGFRAWTQKLALDKDLTGYVRNVDHNTVEAVFEGQEEKVKQMVKECSKGPEVSWVKSVDVKWENPTGEFEGFEVRY